MKIVYERKNFGDAKLGIIYQANRILLEYEQMGYDLTLRQLYYQFVARGFIANKQSEYNRLGSIVNDARLAGMIDWDHIVDRTRELRYLPHWGSPAEIVRATSKQFAIDKWADQDKYLEVWIEKDALIGVIEGICRELDVPYFSCRGYTSQSEMWGAAQRLGKQIEKGKYVRIIHLGDHDPSGLDMTRDIRDRLWHFTATDWLAGRHNDGKRMERWKNGDGTVNTNLISAGMDELEPYIDIERIALNMNQVDEYDPPPNPAKITDSRARGYIREWGNESWELDALPPDVLSSLIEDAVLAHRDEDRWEEAMALEDRGREQLGEIATKLEHE